MENEELKRILETLLFITDHPLSAETLGKIAGVKDQARVGALVTELRGELDQRASALQILEVADGFQMATRASYAPIVRKLFAERMTMKLSTAAHETLSIVAYKQPLTRAEIEEIRGVEVIAALETLLERRLIKVVGRKETVGRPLMYGTTMEFMRHFGLKSLEDLPPIENFAAEDPASGSERSLATSGDALSPGAAAPEAPIAAVAEEAPVEETQAAQVPGNADTAGGQ